MPKLKIDLKTGKLTQKECVVGIDLGTTNSLVAFINTDGNAEIIKQNGNTLVPSIIHIDKNSQILVGNDAMPMLLIDPQNTLYSIKRFLGKSYEDFKSIAHQFSYKIIDDEKDSLVKIAMHGNYYNPIELSAMLLKKLKEEAEKVLCNTISGAVITVPAYFNDTQRQATRDAGKLAGINVLRIINEPTAASLAYGVPLNNLTKTIAVFDLGGGTFDISVLRIEQGVFEVLSTYGDTYLGGDDIDNLVLNYWVNEIKGLQKLMDDTFAIGHFRLIAKKAKEALSNQLKFEESVDFEKQSYLLSITIEKFNDLITPIIEKTMAACKQAINDAELNKTDIEEVILVGGSTRIKAISKAVQLFFDNAIINATINPDEVVAKGAAIEADILAGNRKDTVLLDVTPLSLGIEMVGGLMDVVIPRNSKIPCNASKEYTTSVDGQINLSLSIYQGEREMVIDNRKLTNFVLKNIPAMPAGFPKIKVTFMLNADGILKVSAQEKRTNIMQEIAVKPTHGLEDSQIEKMLLESIHFAKNDVEKRQNEETKNEANQLIYTIQKFLNNNTPLLALNELKQTEILLDDLKEKLQKNVHRNTIVKAIDALNNYTKPFAEKLMDIAINNALKGKKINE